MGEEDSPQRRELLISKGWVQAAALVFLIGFFILGLLAYRTYQAKPPIPVKVVDPHGEVLYTGEDVSEGQQVFLHNGLMEYGSVFGHGAYLGPDFTADYLRRVALLVTRRLWRRGLRRRRAQDGRGLPRRNSYDEDTKTVTVSAAQADAFRELEDHYSDFFSEPTSRNGLRPDAITDPERAARADVVLRLDRVGGVERAPGPQLHLHEQLALRAAGRQQADRERDRLVGRLADRPAGRDRPPVRRLRPLGRTLGWHGREQATLSFRPPGDVALTPAQRATAWFFFVMAALFLIQTFVGAASQHYRADIADFFGFDLAQILPYNLMRTWHVQLALFWVATSFVAAGIFLAPMIARREPKHQGKLAFALLGALAIVVFGTLVGSYLGIHGVLEDAASNWFGLQGFEYLDLARLWQVLLSIGLFFWVFMLWRVLRKRLARRAPRQHALAVLPRRLRDPGLLRGRPDRADRRQLHGHRVLALLGRPPLGRGLPRAVHDGDGRLHVRPARRGPREGRARPSSSSTSSSTRSAASSGRCTTSTSPASPPSTWRSAPSSRPPR